MRRLLVVGCVLLVGCQSAEERCHDIYIQTAVGHMGGVPPKPSDVAWSDEHCWEGKPR